jgi:hypothetical protein
MASSVRGQRERSVNRQNLKLTAARKNNPRTQAGSTGKSLSLEMGPGGTTSVFHIRTRGRMTPIVRTPSLIPEDSGQKESIPLAVVRTTKETQIDLMERIGMNLLKRPPLVV